MAVARQSLHQISEQDYLDGELLADHKSEYIDGEIYAMSGASANHNRIAGNAYAALHAHLKGKPCQPYTSDMKVKAQQHFFYPDVLVDCSHTDGYFTSTPTLIIEVLSKSTRRTDETIKRLAYTQITTLQEYVLIEQDFVDIEIIRRKNGWQSERFFLGDDITFDSIGLTISVADLYDRVNNSDMTEWREAQAAQSSQNAATHPLPPAV